jgi:secreted Zn-dependent insulinase-like peptidase
MYYYYFPCKRKQEAKSLYYIKKKPGRYLSHLIGHEGQGSILSLLKKHGWANYLQVGTIHGGIGFEFLRISVDLTDDGLGKFVLHTCYLLFIFNLTREIMLYSPLPASHPYHLQLS